MFNIKYELPYTTISALALSLMEYNNTLYIQQALYMYYIVESK